MDAKHPFLLAVGAYGALETRNHGGHLCGNNQPGLLDFVKMEDIFSELIEIIHSGSLTARPWKNDSWKTTPFFWDGKKLGANC